MRATQARLLIQQAREEAARLATQKQRTKLKHEKARLEQQRAAVAAKTKRHLTRLSSGHAEGSPWDEELIWELRGLLARGLDESALDVALAITTRMVSWRAPGDTLMRCLESAVGPVAVAARADHRFIMFVRGQVIPAHLRWAAGERQKERARLSAQMWGAETDSEMDRRRLDGTALRRPIAKRY